MPLLEWKHLTEALTPAPWSLLVNYTYPSNTRPHCYVPAGGYFTTLRRTTEELDTYQVGDDIQMVDIYSKAVVSTGKIVALKKTRLDLLTHADYMMLQMGKFIPVDELSVRDHLESIDHVPCRRRDEMVYVITIQLDKDYGAPPLGLSLPVKIWLAIHAVLPFYIKRIIKGYGFKNVPFRTHRP